MKKALIIVFVLTNLSSVCYAQQPIEALQNSIDQSLRILNNPLYKVKSQKELQRQMLWRELNQIFDFREFSKRILAKNWRRFSTRQQEEFVELIGTFMNINSIPRLQRNYNNEKVTLIDQYLLNANKAVVKAKVRWKKKDIPFEVKMLNYSGAWKIYDISALGFSAVGLYRGQFQSILRKQTPQQIIDKLKAKIEKVEDKMRRKQTE
jgi:phospholipid transport system substrate-binding protein